MPGHLDDRPHLRAFERRVLDLHSEGMPVQEIATRFRKSPGFVQRVLDWTSIPRNGTRRREHRLSPMESRVLAMRAAGDSHDEIASRFRKTVRFIRQVEGLAHFKEGKPFHGAEA
jgi:hypothetical protein